MAQVKSLPVKIEAQAVLVLGESEILAIDALIGYGVDSFLEAFYKHLGRAYMEPHEAGLRAFFAGVAGVAGHARAAQECREFMAQMTKEKA